MDYIRFEQSDPNFRGMPTQVLLAVAQIVRIEPVYWREGWLLYVPGREPPEGALLTFVVHDSLGNKYDYLNASPEGRKLIEHIWESAK